MKLRRIQVPVFFALASASATSQEPAELPCRDNPLVWERRAGPTQALSETNVVVGQGIRDLGAISVAEILEQLPSAPEPRGPNCSTPYETAVGGYRWSVAECGYLDDEMIILRLEPGQGNRNSSSFTITLFEFKCRIDTNVQPDEAALGVFDAFQQLTREELDRY